MLALFLIKPLFSFNKSSAADNAVEIKRADSPLLFEAIEDIVKNTGNKMPKHVYLPSDVNDSDDKRLWYEQQINEFIMY